MKYFFHSIQSKHLNILLQVAVFISSLLLFQWDESHCSSCLFLGILFAFSAREYGCGSARAHYSRKTLLHSNLKAAVYGLGESFCFLFFPEAEGRQEDWTGALHITLHHSQTSPRIGLGLTFSRRCTFKCISFSP